jgi:hypothetical protein
MSQHNKFTSEQREILISEVQLKPILWNDYKDTKIIKIPKKQKKIWDEVGAICGLTGKYLTS